MSTIVDADTLDAAIDFDAPFNLNLRDDAGRVTLSRADGVYAPSVELDPKHGLLVDDYTVDRSPWRAVSGHSGQHGYDDPIMHASEFIGGGMADYLLSTAEDCPTYVVCEVAVTECDDECMMRDDHTPEDVAAGTWDHEPGGWILLELRP